ncbi:MAG: 2,3-bisphosphoglycerate-independent phosphoglycerate mutase [Candidatus Hermodarchaeia archaeon]|jgi:2,3-bisphosphoglycerate-independent phosphoglycerate mutase
MFLPLINKKTSKIKPVVLLVLDGFGMAPASEGNAVSRARTPNYDTYLRTYPHGALIASGESVGLPANEVGNTEVGHLALGAGRVIFQDLKRINVAIEKGSFFDNRAFLSAAAHVERNKSKMHLLGLVGSGCVHSSVDHLYALLQFCKKEEVGEVFLHLFTDGRDSPPQQGMEIIENIEKHLKNINLGSIASISGRYYAMDRDRRWDRTKKTYKALVLGHAIQTQSASDAIKSAYARGQTDEFIEPTLVVSTKATTAADGKGPILIDNDDAVIFFNFRVDRPKQLTMAFVVSDFENLRSFDFGYDPITERRAGEVEVKGTFAREKALKNLFFVTMTEYQKNLPVSDIAFGPEVVEKPLSVVLSENGFQQAHVAESEKERFVKYYFNGQREDPVEGETDCIVASPKVLTYDKKPEMSLPKLISEFKKLLKRDVSHFFIVNFANPDMVAHSGSVEATIKAVEYVDKYLAELVEAVLNIQGTIIVTADHGNAEELLTFPTSTYFYTTSEGSVNTDHSNNPVPYVVISSSLKGQSIQLPRGSLCDIAPTILHLMGIPTPKEMTGKNLLAGIEKPRS